MHQMSEKEREVDDGEIENEELGDWVYDVNTQRKKFGGRTIIPFIKLISEYVNNGIFYVTATTMVFFGFAAIVWQLIYSISAVSKELRLQDFSGAFRPITFNIAFIQSKLTDLAKDKSTSRVKLYADLLNELDNLKRTLACIRISIDQEPFGKRYSRPGTKETEQGTLETNKLARKHIREISILLFILTKYSYQLFQPHDPVNDWEDFMDADTFYKYDELLRKPIGARFRSETTNDIFKNAVLFMDFSASHMLHQGVIPNAMFKRISDDIYKINNEVNEVNKAQRIFTPQVFNFVEYFILGFYLLILTPLEVYSNTEDWLLLIYPTILALYVLPILFGDWLKDPFAKNPRYDGPEVLAWRNKLYREINILLLSDRIPLCDDRASHKNFC